ncbi:hypothetical protein ACIP1G_23015 [Pseudomonas sp. NPDC089392]|uniref:hypothetical protein n=1 Tax=Pseudomonas sp. NPDC089392 TaxID=3364459 RepID=UPI00382DB8F5
MAVPFCFRGIRHEEDRTRSARNTDRPPFYTINQDTPSVDALVHTLQLMAGIEDSLDEYICANAGVPGINMLVNAVHYLQMTKALAELLLHRQTGDITRG